MYDNLAKFINRANERVFNDSLMRVVVVEIKLKSGQINEEMILPRCYNKAIVYDGETYNKCAQIKDLIPKQMCNE